MLEGGRGVAIVLDQIREGKGKEESPENTSPTATRVLTALSADPSAPTV